MNKNKKVAAGILLAILTIAGLAWAGVEGSKHDFSHKAWTKGDTCSACHTPHTSNPPKAAPLWDANADLSRTFGTPISGGSRPGSGTLMCIRCHDGTIAKDTISGQAKHLRWAKPRFANKQHPGLFESGHQTSDHPVGVDYPGFDRGFRPAATVIAGGTVTLPAGKVECISCHDPHNTSGEPYMLVTGNGRSALCLTCHKK